MECMRVCFFLLEVVTAMSQKQPKGVKNPAAGGFSGTRDANDTILAETITAMAINLSINHAAGVDPLRRLFQNMYSAMDGSLQHGIAYELAKTVNALVGLYAVSDANLRDMFSDSFRWMFNELDGGSLAPFVTVSIYEGLELASTGETPDELQRNISKLAERLIAGQYHRHCITLQMPGEDPEKLRETGGKASKEHEEVQASATYNRLVHYAAGKLAALYTTSLKDPSTLTKEEQASIGPKHLSEQWRKAVASYEQRGRPHLTQWGPIEQDTPPVAFSGLPQAMNLKFPLQRDVCLHTLTDLILTVRVDEQKFATLNPENFHAAGILSIQQDPRNKVYNITYSMLACYLYFNLYFQMNMVATQAIKFALPAILDSEEHPWHDHRTVRFNDKGSLLEAVQSQGKEGQPKVTNIEVIEEKANE